MDRGREREMERGRRGTAPGKWKVVGYVFSSMAKICLKTPKVVLPQLLRSVHLSTPTSKKTRCDREQLHETLQQPLKGKMLSGD